MANANNFRVAKRVNNQISVSINMLGGWFVIVARNGASDLGWHVFLAVTPSDAPQALWTKDLSEAIAFDSRGAAMSYARCEGLQVIE